MWIFNMVWGWGSGYKSYTQLKAMTLANAITELNTDPQWYYDNLNGNGHIIGIWIANDDKTSYQCFDSVTPIIYWNWAWRNWEIIIVKIKTDSSGNLMIPKAWYNTSWSQAASYNWRVSYDGWTETKYSGSWSAGSITIASGLTADTEHTVVIRPNSESYLWARAFWFYNSWVQTYLTEIVYEWSYKWYGSSSSDSWNHFRRGQYRWCTSLTTASQEVLPNTITSIWGNFRTYQYSDCTNLTKALQEVCPDTVTSIWNYFRYYQYQNCTSLTSASQEVFTSWVTSIWNYFRSFQYQNCTNLTTASTEVLQTWITTIWTYFRSSQYSWCTSLTTLSQEVLPNTITSIWDYFRNSQYSWCTSLLSSAPEVLSNSITSIWNYFRYYQYNWCTSLLSAAPEALPNTVTTIWNYFRYNQYYWCTSLATAAQEVCSNSVTSIWDYFRGYQYKLCTSLITSSKEILPDTVTTIWTYFRAHQYYWCTSLASAAPEVLPDTVTSIWSYFRAEQYRDCTSLTEIQWWKDLSIWNTFYRTNMYSWCTAMKTVKVFWDVWYSAINASALANGYVSVVLVPSAYLQNYIDATTYPRSQITNSKFVWY